MASIFNVLMNDYPDDALLKTLSSMNTSYISDDAYNKIRDYLLRHHYGLIPLESLNALAALLDNNYETVIYDKIKDVYFSTSHIIIAACACRNMQLLKRKLEKKQDSGIVSLACGYIIHGIEFIHELVEENYVTMREVHRLMVYACNKMDLSLVEYLMKFGEDTIFEGIIQLIQSESHNMTAFSKLCNNCDLNVQSRYDILVKAAIGSEIHFKYLVSIGVDLLRSDVLNIACKKSSDSLNIVRSYVSVIDYLLINGVEPNKETLTIVLNDLRRSPTSIIHIFKKHSIDFSHINQQTEGNNMSLLTSLGIDHQFASELLMQPGHEI